MCKSQQLQYATEVGLITTKSVGGRQHVRLHAAFPRACLHACTPRGCAGGVTLCNQLPFQLLPASGLTVNARSEVHIAAFKVASTAAAGGQGQPDQHRPGERHPDGRRRALVRAAAGAGLGWATSPGGVGARGPGSGGVALHAAPCSCPAPAADLQPRPALLLAALHPVPLHPALSVSPALREPIRCSPLRHPAGLLSPPPAGAAQLFLPWP